MLAKKKKKADKVQRRFDKEKEINRQVWGGESQNDMEVELELEEPMKMGDDVSASEDEGGRGAAMTLVERCKPTATPVGGERGMETCGDVPESRKHVASGDTAVKREAKRARSPCPSEAPSTSQPLLQV